MLDDIIDWKSPAGIVTSWKGKPAVLDPLGTRNVIFYIDIRGRGSSGD